MGKDQRARLLLGVKEKTSGKKIHVYGSEVTFIG
jgi:hypothetical protein